MLRRRVVQDYVFMFRVFNLAVVTFFIALLFTGCESTDPNPEDTVIGQPGRPLNGDGVVGDYSGIQGNTGGTFSSGDGLGGTRSDDFNSGDFAAGMGQNVMDSVYFGFDQSSIPPAERPKVEAAAQYLRDNPSARLIAEGHTDAIGTAEYNNALSDRRANSVKTYLEQLGIPGDRVEVLAMGELNANQSATKGSAASANDRRVDLITN